MCCRINPCHTAECQSKHVTLYGHNTSRHACSHTPTPIHAYTYTFSLYYYCCVLPCVPKCAPNWQGHTHVCLVCTFLHCYKLCNYACQVTALVAYILPPLFSLSPPPLPNLTTLFLSLSFSKGYIQSQPRSQGDQLSSTNLYIRGLSQRCTDEDLVKMCHQWVFRLSPAVLSEAHLPWEEGGTSFNLRCRPVFC